MFSAPGGREEKYLYPVSSAALKLVKPLPDKPSIVEITSVAF